MNAITSISPRLVCDQLRFNHVRLYSTAVIFSALTIVTPYILHQFHIAGQVLLPMYFFVLIAAYKYGWRAGMVTACIAPLVSYALTGMPIVPILYFVIAKGTVLAIVTGLISQRIHRVSVVALLGVISVYQLFGIALVFGITQNWTKALLDIQMGWPGLLLQIIGGYFVLTLFSIYAKRKELPRDQ